MEQNTDKDLREQFPANVEGSNQFNELNQLTDKKYLNRAEWCFQFFDTDPVPFAYSKEDGSTNSLILEVHPVESDGIQFSYKGMVFKIFPREMSEETKKELENGNKDKEITQ